MAHLISPLGLAVEVNKYWNRCGARKLEPELFLHALRTERLTWYDHSASLLLRGLIWKMRNKIPYYTLRPSWDKACDNKEAKSYLSEYG